MDKTFLRMEDIGAGRLNVKNTLFHYISAPLIAWRVGVLPEKNMSAAINLCSLQWEQLAVAVTFCYFLLWTLKTLCPTNIKFFEQLINLPITCCCFNFNNHNLLQCEVSLKCSNMQCLQSKSGSVWYCSQPTCFSSLYSMGTDILNKGFRPT